VKENSPTNFNVNGAYAGINYELLKALVRKLYTIWLYNINNTKETCIFLRYPAISVILFGLKILEMVFAMAPKKIKFTSSYCL